MKKIICDICTVNEGQTLSLYVGSEMGPAGSTDSNYESFDICLSCLIKKLNSCKNNHFNNELIRQLNGR